MLLHNRKILAAVLLANVVFAAVIVSWQRPAPPDALEPLQLVTEKRISLVSEVPASKPVVEKQQSAPERICRIWGPVERREELDSIADVLEAPQIFTEQISVDPKFMVLIPVVDRAEGTRISGELTAAKVENYATVRGGRRLISVGIFSSLERADLYQGKIRALGYEVETEILSRTREVYSLRGFTTESSAEFASSNSPCPAIADS